ncbi:MAG: MATE family efflux transporter [Cellvibrionaceae bacterium]|nr:MATE family efflux transporter [Cellvibrionaceae bacterium]
MSTAKYTQGSILQHLLLMSGSAMVGLVTLFLSDLVDMYFLSLLGETTIAAAVGFAGSILFFTTSTCIGLMIGSAALVSQNIGAGDLAHTRKTVTECSISSLLIIIPLTVVMWLAIPSLLSALGAEGRTFDLACQYLQLIIPSMPILALSMTASGIMRAQGDAKGAMNITLIGGVVNVLLDPMFIFGLNMGIQGAAVATILSRVAMLCFGYYCLVHREQLLGPLVIKGYLSRFYHYNKTAIPAVITNLSTPLGVAIVTAYMAQFGDSAVAGNAIISRIQPVAFAGLFALSGVVGPIAGQNLGARQLERVRATLTLSIRLVIGYCLLTSLLLWASKPLIVPLFNASAEANALVYLFCNGISLLFIFNGLTMITNAMFNNLGVAHYSTLINVLRATVGTVPFVALGAYWGGPSGILWGLFAGYLLFGLLSVSIAWRFLNRLQRNCAAADINRSNG